MPIIQLQYGVLWDLTDVDSADPFPAAFTLAVRYRRKLTTSLAGHSDVR